MSQAKSREVIEVLQSAEDDREAENKLVILLGYDAFDFIRTLKKHRQMILHCTLLASAQSAQERAELRQRMEADPQLRKILRLLENAVREEVEEEERAAAGADRRPAQHEAMEVDGEGGQVRPGGGNQVSGVRGWSGDRTGRAGAFLWL